MLWLAALCAVVGYLLMTTPANRWHVVDQVAGKAAYDPPNKGFARLERLVRDIERFSRLSPDHQCRAYFDQLPPLPKLFETGEDAIEVIGATRIYNRCYLDGYSDENPPPGLEREIYPWITGEMPVIEDWQRNVVKTFPPVPKGQPFWPHFLNQTSGRGIVVTLGDRHMDDLAGLIRVLRLLNNTLPIEVVNVEPILNYTTQLIAYLATTSDIHGLQQRVLFVNITASVNPQISYQLGGWGRKTLAMVFSLFAEVMLLDCDTVFVKPPAELFEHQGYKDTGTLYFRDRLTNVVREDHVLPLLKRLAPLVWDNKAFSVPLWTNEIWDTCYMKYNHNERLEAGVVLVDKHQKLSSMLMTTQGFRTNELTQWSHGEKEYFWLGPSLNGDENFAWAGDRAGMIGTRISGEELTHPHSDIVEVCGMQVAHFVHGELFWFNGGFHAKGAHAKGDWTEEMWEGRERYKHLNLTEFIKAGHLPFRITYGIIPPNDIARGGKDEMFAYNNDNYPNAGLRILYKPWLWCGYLVSGGPNNRMEGTVFEMTPEQTEWYETVARVWDDKYQPQD